MHLACQPVSSLERRFHREESAAFTKWREKMSAFAHLRPRILCKYPESPPVSLQKPSNGTGLATAPVTRNFAVGAMRK
jgi:hypothetical protein